jgi:hypothetical protein
LQEILKTGLKAFFEKATFTPKALSFSNHLLTKTTSVEAHYPLTFAKNTNYGYEKKNEAPCIFDAGAGLYSKSTGNHV